MKNKKRVIFILLLIIILVLLRIKNNKKNKMDYSVDSPPQQQEKPTQINNNLLKAGDYRFEIKQNNIKRYYLLHIPASREIRSSPLVLAFHGGMGSAENMAENYNLIEKSNKEGFVIAFLNGASRFPSGKFATWNAGNCCAYAVESQSLDVEFVKETISDIKNKINIDKIFATGMSNGGMFSHRLACEMPDTFSAIAAIAGTNNYNDCHPKKPISILHIHSLKDQHVLFEGGCGPDCKVTTETEFVSVDKTISDWVIKNNCDKNPKKVLNKNGAYCDLYINCNEGVEVKLCVTDDGGHSWPGSKTNSANKLEKNPPSQKISATDEIWDFFKSH